MREEVKYMNKKTVLTAIAITILGTGMFASTRVFAQSASDPMSTLVTKIADKFGLKKADVQSVFDQDRSDRQAEMEAKFESTLTQAITDGKLTETQKQLIIAKRKELDASRLTSKPEDMQGKTEEERKAAMEANKTKMETERKALEDWAKQNGIDTKYLMGGFGMHGGPGRPGGLNGPEGMGKPPDTTPTPIVATK
jgi:hypothetical protein